MASLWRGEREGGKEGSERETKKSPSEEEAASSEQGLSSLQTRGTWEIRPAPCPVQNGSKGRSRTDLFTDTEFPFSRRVHTCTENLEVGMSGPFQMIRHLCAYNLSGKSRTWY